MKKITFFIIFWILLFGMQVRTEDDHVTNQAMEHVRFLASDALQGRKSGTPGYQKAAEYVAQKMEEYGLKPGGTTDSFFQTVEFKNWKHFSPPTRLEITSPGKLCFFPGQNRDFFPFRGTGSGISQGKTAFAGYGIVSSKHKWNDYIDLDVRGRIVILLPGAPEFLGKISKKTYSPGTKIKTALDKGAAGVLFIKIEKGFSRRSLERIKKGLCPDNFVVLTAQPHVIDHISELSGKSWRTSFSRTLREKKSFTSLLDVEMEMEAHFSQETKTAPNVIGFLPGEHQKLKNEYILIGAHLDHLGIGLDGSVYNGADDNAASVAVLLELAGYFQETNFKPDRTLVFIAWAGEEVGLVGSRYYVKHPLFPLDKTCVYINMDMVGTGDNDLYVSGMWEFADFFNILKKNMKPEFKDKLQYRVQYRGSDHSAFLSKGVIAISLRTGNPLTRGWDNEHPEYHKPGDESTTIQPELLQIVTDYHTHIIEFLVNCKNNLLIPKHHIYFLHKNAFIADMHCDTIGRQLEGVDLAEDNEKGHIDIPKLKQGAMDLQVFACYVAPPQNDLQKSQAAKKAFDQIDAVHELVEKNPDDLVLIRSHDDLKLLRRTRKTGILIGIEGGYAIENDLRLLRSFYRSGVRLMTLTHWTDTDWADASGDPEAQLGGLTEFGMDVVKEMNKLGMIIDVSHAHDSTFWDVIKLTDSPVVASHSCCRALSDHHRNLTDKMLKALAKNGGVIGINYARGFLNADNSTKLRSLRSRLLQKYDLPQDRSAFSKIESKKKTQFQEEYKIKSDELSNSLPPVDVRTVVDHIEHVIKVTGNANHVGLGSDFDGIGRTPDGLEHVGLVSNITAELVRRGVKENDIRKILGGNFLRVLKKVCSPKGKQT